MGSDNDHKPELSDYRARRAEIGEDMSEIERALAAPVGLGTAWHEQLTKALSGLKELATIQFDDLSGPTGVVAQLEVDVPPLSGRARQLLATFEEGLSELDRLIASNEPAEQRREDVISLLGQAARIRQGLADLLWEAYWVDVGGGG
ncbi:MAG: hypothetical protein OEV40_10940 [Acidimicrobiia bacterium]|nr:hypothetical protein [Acidimicrobiia bacterium]